MIQSDTAARQVNISAVDKLQYKRDKAEKTERFIFNHI